MANEWLDTGINAYVRDLIKPMLHSAFARAKPLTAWLAGESTTGLDKLGDPDVGLFYGGKDLGIGQKSQISGSVTHKFRFQKDQTDAATNVTAGGDTPVAGGFAEDNVGTCGVNWTQFMAPIKVREDSILNAVNGGGSDEMVRLKIADILEEAVSQGFQKSLESLQTNLWTGTLTAAQQAATVQTWANCIGVLHWCDDAVLGTTTYNIVGGVNRLGGDGQGVLKGNVVDGDTIGSTITLRQLRKMRLLTNPDGTNNLPNGALRSKRANAGNLIILNPTLWEKLANDADSNNQINSNDIPQFARTGHMNPAIRLDDSFLVWDHDCPANTFVMLTTADWVFEVQQGSNFVIGDWTKKWESEEGGGFYRWTNIHAKYRLTCRRPDLQLKGIDFDET